MRTTKKATKLPSSRRSNGRAPLIEVPLKLDLGCGQRKRVPIDGEDATPWVGVDLYAPGADQKVDLFRFPWPWKDGSVSQVHCSHFCEHIPQDIRWKWFEELWRVMKVDGVAQIVCPNWKSERAYGDCSHQWPPVTSFSFLYFSRAWREANLLTHGPYALKCNFETQTGAFGLAPDVASRADDVKMMMCQRQCETYQDMWATMRKLPM